MTGLGPVTHVFAVHWGDAAYIEDMVERGRKIRRSLIELKQA